jgi:hypothetical protein
VGLRVPHRFEGCTVNGVLDFIIKLPNRRAFQVKGKIRHIRNEADGGGLFGAEFVNLRDEHRELLRDYINELLKAKPKISRFG